VTVTKRERVHSLTGTLRGDGHAERECNLSRGLCGVMVTPRERVHSLSGTLRGDGHAERVRLCAAPPMCVCVNAGAWNWWRGSCKSARWSVRCRATRLRNRLLQARGSRVVSVPDEVGQAGRQGQAGCARLLDDQPGRAWLRRRGCYMFAELPTSRCWCCEHIVRRHSATTGTSASTTTTYGLCVCVCVRG
jgi:hypothetical protein